MCRMKIERVKRVRFVVAVLLSFAVASAFSRSVDHAQGEMSGEPTQTTILLQSRLTQGNHFVEGDIVGAAGVARFEISKSLSFRDPFKTDWIQALPEDPDAVTYRTYRIGKLLQIWLLEGRDYRSPNSMPDGPQKSIWGDVQKEWLKKTLLASTATFKLVISPTPMVGPDDGYKSDNHTNPKGFKQEGDAFFTWLKANGFLEKHFYFVCGDRHWQYHSMHPSGFEEFFYGALVENNARLRRAPGDPESTDPQALVKQIYTQQEASAGFLNISVIPGTQDEPHTLSFDFYDEHGNLLYVCRKTAVQ